MHALPFLLLPLIYLLYYRVFTCCTTVCLPVALLFVYVLCYRWFTFCTTVGLPFALPLVYRLHYHLFTFCTTFCLRFVLPCYFLFTFCTTVRRTTAVSGVRRITFRAKTCRASVCRRSAGWPNECPSAVVRLSIGSRGRWNWWRLLASSVPMGYGRSGGGCLPQEGSRKWTGKKSL